MEYTKAKGVSKRTLEYYEERLTKAFAVLRNPYAVTSDDIIRYLNTIDGNEYGYATRHCSFRVLRTFYRWLNRQYGLPYPMHGVPVPFIAKEVVLPTLRLNEIKQILQSEDTKSKAIITLAAASALRRTELANINVEDIDWTLKRIKVKTRR